MPVFCLLFGVSSDCAQPITGQVTEVTCPVIGCAQPGLTPSKRQKPGPGLKLRICCTSLRENGLGPDDINVLSEQALTRCTPILCGNDQLPYGPRQFHVTLYDTRTLLVETLKKLYRIMHRYSHFLGIGLWFGGRATISEWLLVHGVIAFDNQIK